MSDETVPWLHVDRRWFRIHRARDRQKDAVVDAARTLYPWLRRWEIRGVGPDIQALIDALEALGEGEPALASNTEPATDSPKEEPGG